MRYKIAASNVILLILAMAIWGTPAWSIENGLLVDKCPREISTVYSPYSVHLIKAEVGGKIKKVIGKEGQMLIAGTPVVEIDCAASAKELEKITAILSDLKKKGQLLEKDLGLAKNKFKRYQRLFQKGHIEKQALEEIELLLDKAYLAVIDNHRQQEEISRALIQTKDRLEKCAPSFEQDLYVSEIFKERYDTVIAGEALARLLDVSRAKVHLTLPIECFKRVKGRLADNNGTIGATIFSEDGTGYHIKASIEKLKLDTDSEYLYSYGFDLVFDPIKQLLFGEVVRVTIEF